MWWIAGIALIIFIALNIEFEIQSRRGRKHRELERKRLEDLNWRKVNGEWVDDKGNPVNSRWP